MDRHKVSTRKTYNDIGAINIKTTGEIVFNAVILVFAIVLAIASLGYNPTARLIPLILCIILAILVVIQIAKRVQSIWKNKIEDLPQIGLVSLFRIVLWLVCFILALKYINYLIVIPVFFFLFLFYEGRVRLIHAVIMALGMELFYYLVFYQFLNSVLPR